MGAINILVKPASGLCNFRCKYCFYVDEMKNREVASFGIMDGKTQEIMVKNAFSYASHHCGFVFQGGEPTLAGLDYFKRHVELVKQYRKDESIEVTNVLQTNGYLIDDEWASFLAENHFLVGLSIDGNKEINDSCRLDSYGNSTFNRVMQTVNLLNKYKVDYNILTVVTGFNSNRVQKLMNFYKKNNFRYVQFIPCIDPFDCNKSEFTLTSEKYTIFLQSTFDFYYNQFKSGNYISMRNFDNYIRIINGGRPESCDMNGHCTCYFVVEGDGSVYPCDFYVLDRYKLGNVKENSFGEMYVCDKAKEFINQSIHKNSQCLQCRWFNICRGGCRRYREPFVNGKPGLNKFCSSYKQFFEKNISKLYEIALMVKNQCKIV